MGHLHNERKMCDDGDTRGESGGEQVDDKSFDEVCDVGSDGEVAFICTEKKKNFLKKNIFLGAKMADKKRYTKWVFICRDWTEEDWKICKEIKCTYLLCEKEIGPETGLRHIQGCLILKDAQTASALQKKTSPRFSFRVMYGKPTECVTYCTKDAKNPEDVIERGRLPEQGKRNDIHKMKQMVENGAAIREVIDVATSYQGLRTAELLIKYQGPVKRDKVDVYWYYGETGCGKTYNAIKEAGDDYWISGKNLTWWQGYCGQKNIVIDDFRRDFCTFHELLRICDKYPYMVSVKGSAEWLHCDKVWITCPKHPRALWEGHSEEDMNQLMRRITVIKHFEDVYKKVDENYKKVESSEKLEKVRPEEDDAEVFRLSKKVEEVILKTSRQTRLDHWLI